MSNEFDLTAIEELSAHRNESIQSLATKVRNASDDFDGTHSQDDVIRTLLEERLSTLRESRQKVEEKQANLRERLGVSSEQSGTEAQLSEAEAKQEELRQRMQR